MKKQAQKVAVLTGFVLLTLSSGLAGSMKSYAAGPGETTVAKPLTYNQQVVKALGNWEQQGSTWKFKCLDGSYLANSWIESLSEAGAYYFVGADGIMLLNSKTPDGYTVDGSGLWRSGAVATGSNVDSSVNSPGSKAETGKTTGRTEERLTQEYMDFVKEHAGASAYGGLH